MKIITFILGIFNILALLELISAVFLWVLTGERPPDIYIISIMFIAFVHFLEQIIIFK